MKALFTALAAILVVATAARAHDATGRHDELAAGSPGDGAIARTINVTVREEGDGRMRFDARELRFPRGAQIRFVVRNEGRSPHEFRIDSMSGNAAHKAMMAEMPGMVHHDANAVSIAPGRTATLVWRFTRPGTYEYACLLPGHYEAGMHGAIVVAPNAK